VLAAATGVLEPAFLHAYALVPPGPKSSRLDLAAREQTLPPVLMNL